MITLNSLVHFFSVFILAFLGAMCNDFYKTMNEEDERVKVARVLLSAFTGAILIFASFNYVIKYVDTNVIPLLSFISGVTGFSIFEQFKSVDLVCLFWKVIDVIQQEKQESEQKEENKDE